MPEISSEYEERFWSKVAITANPEKCWLWEAGKLPAGYGQFNVRKRNLKAHRVAYVLTHGYSGTDKMFVCHTCDNPSCCNPNHLFLGDHNDNMRDKHRKGRCVGFSGDRNPSRTRPERMKRGEDSHYAKLNEENVREIRRRFSDGETNKTHLANEFKVCPGTICLIINRKNWKHVA